MCCSRSVEFGRMVGTFPKDLRNDRPVSFVSAAMMTLIVSLAR
jgi:hypothetical protein